MARSCRWTSPPGRKATRGCGSAFRSAPARSSPRSTFPLNLAAHKIAPALAVGCPFVLKPASFTPVGALLIGEVLAETELPAGAFSILPCRRDGASQFVEDERLKLLSFTGSPDVGWGPEGARREEEGDPGAGRQRRGGGGLGRRSGGRRLPDRLRRLLPVRAELHQRPENPRARVDLRPLPGEAGGGDAGAEGGGPEGGGHVHRPADPRGGGAAAGVLDRLGRLPRREASLRREAAGSDPGGDAAGGSAEGRAPLREGGVRPRGGALPVPEVRGRPGARSTTAPTVSRPASSPGISTGRSRPGTRWRWAEWSWETSLPGGSTTCRTAASRTAAWGGRESASPWRK